MLLYPDKSIREDARHFGAIGADFKPDYYHRFRSRFHNVHVKIFELGWKNASKEPLYATLGL